MAQYSPQVQVLPRITVRASGDAGGNGDFYIAANDPGVHPTDVSTGTKLRWSISLDNNLVPPGISINAMSGKVSTSMNEGLYAFTIVVRDVNTSVFTVCGRILDPSLNPSQHEHFHAMWLNRRPKGQH